jgi:hypothetical protein
VWHVRESVGWASDDLGLAQQLYGGVERHGVDF